jgi:serine/threonine-protein kinase
MESRCTNPNSGRKPLPETLFGYDVLEYLGEGAGSDIYAVSDSRTHQIYALKHVVRTDPKSERFIEQLQAELEVGRAVSHPGLRRSVELTVNRTLFRKIIDAALVLELFDGQSLEARPTASMETTLDCFIQVGRALDALHAAGYVHCDLKPNNILRAASGEVKVIDLGQACKKGVAKARMQGTPDYMAPEQVKCAPVTARTDIFNFGATLYWALTGKNIPTLFRLKKGSNSFLLDDQIASPQTLNPGVPDALSNLVMECVRTAPSKRPESMHDVTRRLELVLHHVRRASQIEPIGGDGPLPAPLIQDPSPRIEARSYA